MRDAECFGDLPHQGFVIGDGQVGLPFLHVRNHRLCELPSAEEELSVPHHGPPKRQLAVFDVVSWHLGSHHTFLAKSRNEQLFRVAVRAEQQVMTPINEFLADGDGARGMTSRHAYQTVANAHGNSLSPVRRCLLVLSRRAGRPHHASAVVASVCSRVTTMPMSAPRGATNIESNSTGNET